MWEVCICHPVIPIPPAMSVWLEVLLPGKTASEFPEAAEFHIVYAANPADLA